MFNLLWVILKVVEHVVHLIHISLSYFRSPPVNHQGNTQQTMPMILHPSADSYLSYIYSR